MTALCRLLLCYVKLPYFKGSTSFTLCTLKSFIGLDPGALLYSIALQRSTGQTVLLQALQIGHMTSKDYSITKIFDDHFLVSTLSIMLTNRFSPIDTYIK